MKEFLKSMFTDGGEVSSKRVISFLFTIFALWAGVYIVLHYKEFAVTVFGYTLISIGVLTGVTTIPQIVGLIKGGSNDKSKEDEPKKDEQPNSL